MRPCVRVQVHAHLLCGIYSTDTESDSGFLIPEPRFFLLWNNSHFKGQSFQSLLLGGHPEGGLSRCPSFPLWMESKFSDSQTSSALFLRNVSKWPNTIPHLSEDDACPLVARTEAGRSRQAFEPRSSFFSSPLRFSFFAFLFRAALCCRPCQTHHPERSSSGDRKWGQSEKMKSEAMNNVKIPQRGYSENKVFSARRLRMNMEINILGKGREKKLENKHLFL